MRLRSALLLLLALPALALPAGARIDLCFCSPSGCTDSHRDVPRSCCAAASDAAEQISRPACCEAPVAADPAGDAAQGQPAKCGHCVHLTVADGAPRACAAAHDPLPTPVAALALPPWAGDLCATQRVQLTFEPQPDPPPPPRFRPLRI